MVQTLIILVSVTFATGLLLGIGTYYGYRRWVSLKKTLFILVNPESRRIELVRRSQPKDQDYVTIGECDYVLDGASGFQNADGTVFLADSDRGKVFNVAPEEPEDDPIQRLTGHKLNQMRNDMRMKQWHTYQENNLQALAKYAIPALGLIGLTVVAILYVVMNGFGYVG